MASLASAARIVSFSSRGLGVLQLLLGIGIWVGVLDSTIGLHILIGLLLALLLVSAAVIGLRGKESMAKVAVGFAWVPILVGFGLTQASILPGGAHWVIETLHLLVGIGALGLIETLTRRTRGPHSVREKNAVSM